MDSSLISSRSLKMSLEFSSWTCRVGEWSKNCNETAIDFVFIRWRDCRGNAEVFDRPSVAPITWWVAPGATWLVHSNFWKKNKNFANQRRRIKTGCMHANNSLWFQIYKHVTIPSEFPPSKSSINEIQTWPKKTTKSFKPFFGSMDLILNVLR